jgi:hypothetical protein
MTIHCTHCGRDWELPKAFAPKLAAWPGEPGPERIHHFLVQLREQTGMSLLDSKKLAFHISEYGNCISCQAKLFRPFDCVKICASCGALNLDISNVC